MNRQVVCIAVAMVVFSIVLASCSIGGGSKKPEATKATHSVMSYSEKASYYDELVAGENDPIPLTTELNASVTIEGDANLLEDDLYQKIVDLANQVFPRMRTRFSESPSMSITIILDGSSAGYSPCYAAGNTIVLNTDWLNKHPTECDILIETIGSIFFSYKRDTAPSWLIGAMKLYVRDEYGLYKEGSSFELPKHYTGKAYDQDRETAAAFLKWIRQSQQVDIVGRLHRQLRSIDGYKIEVWQATTGKTLDQLWTLYKSSGADYGYDY